MRRITHVTIIMKILVAILLFLSLSPTQAFDRELNVLAGKIRVAMIEKGWQLLNEYIHDETIYQRWHQGELDLKLSFYSCETEEEAKLRFAEDVERVEREFGSGDKTEKLGNQGKEWSKTKGKNALLYFRKGRINVALVSSSIETARNWGRIIAEILPEKIFVEAKSQLENPTMLAYRFTVMTVCWQTPLLVDSRRRGVLSAVRSSGIALGRAARL